MVDDLFDVSLDSVYQCLAQLSSESHHPETDGRRCRELQPNTRRSQENPAEKLYSRGADGDWKEIMKICHTSPTHFLKFQCIKTSSSPFGWCHVIQTEEDLATPGVSCISNWAEPIDSDPGRGRGSLGIEE
ncbi:uncharacterized protein LOC128096701 isoform X3 [Peromyscus californicus insignis]|uniref:uncharacterized protein LOC128096701 isoform X3 n=1 Tax=Peromyscus californicus insignis TaxID=564181 RepID=UPI0022A6BF40|nr:uncharacterized protein LOC128096701 isoform X3 [Peromyscus californicus insignis]